MRHPTEEPALIACDVRPDKRKRVALGAALDGLDDVSFNIYRDRDGRIILEPQASEAWLFRNKRAVASVACGLDQIGDAKVIGSFAKYSDRFQG